ncbi:MAG: GIY-YIG nuclease family protein [Planctomycetaceae bacterium]|nr:GIY-YIG nuclease family protein [Planctomycetaceae bacterium]
MRKSGKLGSGTTRQTRFKDDEYRFAAEMATRHLERRDAVSLDEILIDPSRAEEFDSLCDSLCSGFSPLQYRWSALGLRKQRCLAPEIVAHAVPATAVVIHKCNEVRTELIPSDSGLYIFFDETQTLYVGEASNLRSRLKKHLDHSDNKQLARWFWEHGFENARLELHVLDARYSTRIRRSLESELIRSRKPVFNIQGIDPR